NDLVQVFAEARRAERAAAATRLAVSVACLLAVLALSMGLSRRLVTSMENLASGIRRFGEGDFRTPIRVTSHDQLGELTLRANEMASRLERLQAERLHAEEALTMANRELEAFSYSVAHDLRAPLRSIQGFSVALLEDCGDHLSEEGRDHLRRVMASAERMG